MNAAGYLRRPQLNSELAVPALENGVQHSTYKSARLDVIIARCAIASAE